jgi:single-stranded-DNA-specific exonuclease
MSGRLTREWLWPDPPAPGAAEALAQAARVPVALARVLVARGIVTSEAANEWLSPRLGRMSDPLELPGMDAAVREVAAARARGDRVVIFGDYDVDGITAAALLTETLRAAGLDVRPVLPHRLDDGYGLQPEPTARCIAEHRPGLLVTVDCGTSSVDAVSAAQAAGVRVVITDHHLPGPELAPAEALVNPRLGDPTRAWHELAGVGVAFKLAHALARHAKAEGWPETGAMRARVEAAMDLAALGTLADCVPLRGENRLLAAAGLKALAEPKREGLRALRAVSRMTPGVIRSWEVGFVLAPRLNAAGRLESAEAAMALLLETDPARAMELATGLDTANTERRRIQEETVQQAEDWILAHMDPELDSAIVVADARWHPGIIGIAASRIVARFHRPTVVIALDGDGAGRGSGRSIEGISIVECLADCAPLLTRWGGHAMAAGLSLAAGRVDAFRDAFREAAGRRMTPGLARPKLRIDAEIGLGEINEALAEALVQLEPHGIGHPEPVWGVRNICLRDIRKVGEKHLRMRLTDARAQQSAIGFNLAEAPLPDGPADAAFTVGLNTWQGRTEIQLKLIALTPARRPA